MRVNPTKLADNIAARASRTQLKVVNSHRNGKIILAAVFNLMIISPTVLFEIYGPHCRYEPD